MDAIASAGGPTAKAQLDTVNLAAPIADGEQVVVPGRGPGGVAAASAPAAGSSPTAPLDLNPATLEQLEGLPGIGPVTALGGVAEAHVQAVWVVLDRLMFAQWGRKFGRKFGPEQAPLERRGLVVEDGAGEVEVLAGHLHVGVSGLRISATGPDPEAASFVSDVCRRSWKGRT